MCENEIETTTNEEQMEALKILTSMMKTQEEYDRDFEYADRWYDDWIARADC